MNVSRIVLVVVALTSSMPVVAQTWPSKPVTIVVPYSPGSGVDAVGRFVAERLYERTSQRFIVENRPGAFSMVGTQVVARAAPDGYTLLISTVSAAMNVNLFKKVPYDHIRDFTPVTILFTAPWLLVVSPEEVPVNSAAELTKYIRARPDKIAWGGPAREALSRPNFTSRSPAFVGSS